MTSFKKTQTAAESNNAIAERLLEYADLLESQGADHFREQAYRRAALTLSTLDGAADDILRLKGVEGLINLPGIGKGIAGAIAEMIVTGSWAQLERLRGDLSPARLFQTIPGIGPALSKRLADDEHLETLEDLEAAIHLQDRPIKGLGPRRRQAIAAVLAARLGRPLSPRGEPGFPVPPISYLLKVDSMYRAKAAAGTLRTIAPKRFNPSGRSWLPVMHASHEDWHFTALFSNTARAHQLGRTRDWVVIYAHRDSHAEGRSTIVTETRGPLSGQRVVRGRESECATFYNNGKESDAATGSDS